MKKRSLNSILTLSLWLTALAILAVREVSAQTPSGGAFDFWHKGSPITVFAPRPEAGTKTDLEFAPRVNVSNTQIEPPAELAKASPKDAALDEKDKEVNPRERILKTYGDPEEKAPIKAIDSAPRPYKALMESLQSGDKELAFQYAKQYVRYLRDVQERSTEVVSMVGFAQKREHMIEDGDWAQAPQLMEHKALYQKDIADEKKRKEGSQLSEEDLNSAARQVLSDLANGKPEQNMQNPNLHTTVASTDTRAGFAVNSGVPVIHGGVE